MVHYCKLWYAILEMSGLIHPILHRLVQNSIPSWSIITFVRYKYIERVAPTNYCNHQDQHCQHEPRSSTSSTKRLSPPATQPHFSCQEYGEHFYAMQQEAIEGLFRWGSEAAKVGAVRPWKVQSMAATCHYTVNGWSMDAG